MTAKSGLFAPSLIYSMHGIAAIDNMPGSIHTHKPLTLVTVGIENDMNKFVTIRYDAQHCGMTAAREFGAQVLIRQTYSIIMRMRYLTLMTETGGTLFRLRAKFATYCSHRERPVILGTTANNLMTIADAHE